MLFNDLCISGYLLMENRKITMIILLIIYVPDSYSFSYFKKPLKRFMLTFVLIICECLYKICTLNIELSSNNLQLYLVIRLYDKKQIASSLKIHTDIH